MIEYGMDERKEADDLFAGLKIWTKGNAGRTQPTGTLPES